MKKSVIIPNAKNVVIDKTRLKVNSVLDREPKTIFNHNMRKINLFLPMAKNIIQKAENKSIPNHSRLIRNNSFQVLTRSSSFVEILTKVRQQEQQQQQQQQSHS